MYLTVRSTLVVSMSVSALALALAGCVEQSESPPPDAGRDAGAPPTPPPVTSACATADACGPCGAQPGCGWCATSGQCLRGGPHGPVEGSCTSPATRASPASAFESWGETNPASGSPWSWGYADGAGAFHPFDTFASLVPGAVQQWRMGSRNELAVSRNIGGWVYSYLGGITFPTQEWLHLHPGPARERAWSRDGPPPPPTPSSSKGPSRASAPRLPPRSTRT